MLKRTKRITNRVVKFIIPCTFLGIAGMAFFGSVKLETKNAKNATRIAELDAKIAEEEERSQDIEELRIYMQTDKYVEEIAKQRLGLVYKDEIVFKAKQD